MRYIQTPSFIQLHLNIRINLISIINNSAFYSIGFSQIVKIRPELQIIAMILCYNNLLDDNTSYLKGDTANANCYC